MTTRSTSHHDNLYYLDVIEINVDNWHFKVPQRPFLVSQKFTNLIKALRPGEQPPIIDLKEVRRTDFKNFLKVLIPLRPGAVDNLSVLEWTSVLRFSTEWGFNHVRRQAINFLLSKSANITPGEMIMIAQKFSVGACFRRGCRALIGRDEPVSTGEAQVLGYDMAYHLLLLRDRRLSSARRIDLADVEDTLGKFIERIDREDATHGRPVVFLWKPLRPPASTHRITSEERPTKRSRVGND